MSSVEDIPEAFIIDERRSSDISMLIRKISLTIEAPRYLRCYGNVGKDEKKCKGRVSS